MHPLSASLHAFFKGNSIMMIMIFFLVFEKIAQQPLMRLKDLENKEKKGDCIWSGTLEEIIWED